MRIFFDEICATPTKQTWGCMDAIQLNSSTMEWNCREGNLACSSLSHQQHGRKSLGKGFTWPPFLGRGRCSFPPSNEVEYNVEM